MVGKYPNADRLELGLDGRRRCQALGGIALVYVLIFWRSCHFDYVRQPDRYKYCSNPCARAYEEKGDRGNLIARRMARVGLYDFPGGLRYRSVE